MKLLVCLFIFLPLYAQLVVPSGNLGPAYFYPDNAEDRLYKLPYAEGKTFEMTDGYYNDPNGHMQYSDHPDYSLDFTMPEGEPVLASRGGRVLAMSFTDSSCRTNSLENYVIVSHVDSVPDTARPGFYKKMWTRDTYLHLHWRASVKLGDVVAQGQVLGTIGCSATPHVHFEVNMDGHTGMNDTGYTFSSIPAPYVEIAENSGYPLLGEWWTSQNTPVVSIESPARVRETPLSFSPSPLHAGQPLILKTGLGSVSRLTLLDLRGRIVSDLRVDKAGYIEMDRPAGLYLIRAVLRNNKTLAAKIIIIQ